MSRSARYSAPGKLFLFGEYAILGGGWGVVGAVDRRVTAERRVGDAYTLEGAEASPDLPAAVLQAANADFDVRQVHTDVTPFYGDGKKLGLGSSAASCAAIAALGLEDYQDRMEVFRVAGTAHRAFQAGRGSHADVAASSFGGLLAYRLVDPVAPFPRFDAPPMGGEETIAFARIKRLSWPPEVRARAFWLGEPASSPELIGRVEPAVERREEGVLAALSTLASEGAGAIVAIEKGEADRLLAHVAGSQQAMDALGAATGAPIVTPEAHVVASAAEKLGITLKMSGAGGGDFVFLAGPGDAAWDRLEERCPGLWIDLDFGVEGVRADGAPVE